MPLHVQSSATPSTPSRLSLPPGLAELRIVLYRPPTVPPITVLKLIGNRRAVIHGQRAAQQEGAQMSDAFFEKLFGDSEPGRLRQRLDERHRLRLFRAARFRRRAVPAFPWRCSPFPTRAPIYPMAIIRGLIQGSIVLAIVLGAISGILLRAEGPGADRRVTRTAGGDHRRRQHAAAG